MKHYLFKGEKWLPSDMNGDLRKYLENFDYKMFSNKEKQDLFIKYKNGDQEAFEMLVKGYMKMIISIARKYSNRGVAYEDLIVEGILELKNSFDQFKSIYTVQYQFVRSRVSQAMSNLLYSRTHVVSIPSVIQKEHKRLWQHVESFEQRYERLLSPDDIVNNITANPDLVYGTYQLPRDLSDTICRIDDYDIFESESNNIYDYIDLEYKKELIHYLLNQLRDRESFILKKYFGLEGAKKQLTLESIGDIMGISGERVRQILLRSINRLRDNNNSYDYDNDRNIHDSSLYGTQTINNIHKKEPQRKELPHLGDYVLLLKTIQVGKVISTRMISGFRKFDLRMRSGLTNIINADNTSFVILPYSFGKKLFNKKIEAKEKTLLIPQ